MELNETELAIINRAFEKMPFPDDQQAIDMLREKIKTGVGSLFDNNGESAENMILDAEAKEYVAHLPVEQELFDKDGSPLKAASKESANEVLKVCSALEEYRQGFFQVPKTAPSDDEVRSTLADFRLTWQYLTPENKQKMEALAEVVGYSLPENRAKRIAERRRSDFYRLQEMGKVFKKDKNNLALKNKITESSSRYVEGYLRDVVLLTDPKDVVELGEMALKVNSFIPTTPYGAQYKKSAMFRDKNAEILTWIQKGYTDLGDAKNANAAGLGVYNERKRAAHIREHMRNSSEQSSPNYNLR